MYRVFTKSVTPLVDVWSRIVNIYRVTPNFLRLNAPLNFFGWICWVNKMCPETLHLVYFHIYCRYHVKIRKGCNRLCEHAVLVITVVMTGQASFFDSYTYIVQCILWNGIFLNGRVSLAQCFFHFIKNFTQMNKLWTDFIVQRVMMFFLDTEQCKDEANM